MAFAAEEKDGPANHPPPPATTSPNSGGSIATEPLQSVAIQDDEKHGSEKRSQPGTVKRDSYSSGDTGSDSGPGTKAEPTQDQRSWLDKANPLKKSTKPPVPEQRGVSREHGAGFFSVLTFQWMAPLMSVSRMCPLL